MKLLSSRVRHPAAWAVSMLFSMTAWSQPPPSPSAPERKALPEETAEPTEEFVLEVDGASRTVQVDKPFDVRIGERTVSMRLKPITFRTFSLAGIRFHYPRSHSFQAEVTNADIQSWVLSGTLNTILVYRHAAGTSPEDFQKDMTESMLKESGDPKAGSSDVELAIQGRQVKGKRVDVKQGDTRLRSDIFCFEADKGVTALILQDVPDEQGRTSPETAQATKLLVESFEFAGSQEPSKKGGSAPK